MKFQHLSHDENGPSVVIGSNSAFKGIKTGVSKIEDKHGLPRPPFINNIEGDNKSTTRQDSLNGNTKDGVELQQKKVCWISGNWISLHVYINIDPKKKLNANLKLMIIF